MDKIKDYIKAHEDSLNVELLPDEIWIHLKTRISRVKPIARKRFSFLRQAAVWLIPILLIASFTFRIKKTRVLGNIIALSLPAGSHLSLAELNQWGKIADIDFLSVNNNKPGVSSFISFVPLEKKGALEIFKKESGHFADYVELPIRVISTESVISSIYYRVFNKHIDVKTTDPGELAASVKADLHHKGIRDVNIIIDEQGQGVFIINEKQISVEDEKEKTQTDSLHKTTKPVIKDSRIPSQVISRLPAKFDWILHTWKTKDSSLNSFHRWVKIHDSLYKSYVITLEPDITIVPGYFLYSREDEIFLAKDGHHWKQTSHTENSFVFERETSQFPVKIIWDRSVNSWWFRQIRGSLKDEIPLYIDDSKNSELNRVIKSQKN